VSEGGKEAVRVEDDVVGASEVRRIEERVCELERMLGSKTLEVEIKMEALDLARAKKSDLAVELCAQGRFPMKAVAETLGVARSNIAERVKWVRPRRGPQTREGNLELSAQIRRLMAARPLTWTCPPNAMTPGIASQTQEDHRLVANDAAQSLKSAAFWTGSR
jgi:hypothetical protein